MSTDFHTIKLTSSEVALVKTSIQHYVEFLLYQLRGDLMEDEVLDRRVYLSKCSNIAKRLRL